MSFHPRFGRDALPGCSIKMSEKILKADAFPEKLPGSSPKVLKREAYEASREAHDVVGLAQDKARQIVEEAERERDAILEQARQDGYAEGLANWNQILARTSQKAEDLAKVWEETMLKLSVRVAEKIIGEQLKLHPETIVDIIKEVLQGIRFGKHLTIQVNDEDAPQVRSRVDRLKSSLGVSNEIEIVASASVPRGGCLIESELGVVDARLETQLKCLEDVLVRDVSGD
jgi:type III secretion protein L